MNNKVDGKTHIELLTNVCENVCTFIKTITEENISKEGLFHDFESKVDQLESLCSNLKAQLKQMDIHVKTLANLLNFTFNQDDSSIDILTQWISSLSKKNVDCVKKRKLYCSYSPLKLSLKDNTEVNEDTKNKTKLLQPEKEKKISSPNKLNTVWKLQTKRDGNPSDLLKKSKQTILMFQSQEEKNKMDVTSFNISSSKTCVLNSSNSLKPEVFNAKNDDASKNISQNNIKFNSPIDDSFNVSLGHFHKIIKPTRNVLPIVKTNIFKSKKFNSSCDNVENHDQLLDDTFCCTNISKLNRSNSSHVNNENHNELSNETFCCTNISESNKSNSSLDKTENPNQLNDNTFCSSNISKSNKLNSSHDPIETHNQTDVTTCSPIIIPTNLINNASSSIKRTTIPKKNLLDSFDIIPGLNDKKNVLPNYKFKEDPVRKHNERKLLNGWDCEDCFKFYKANNDNPVEAKAAMNHFSRHRSIKHQHHASTPPGFWDPL